MYTFLAQTIVLARNGDNNGWMEILVLIIVAVIWVIGGIIKSKANKEKDQISEKPASKLRPSPLETAKATRKQPVQQVQPARRKMMRPQPAVHKTAAEAYSLKAQPEQDLPLSISQIQPKLGKLPGLKVTVEGLKGKYTQTPAEKPPTVTALQPLLDFDEPDSLRRAILHYEILGKPLSLRGPSGRIIGL